MKFFQRSLLAVAISVTPLIAFCDDVDDMITTLQTVKDAVRFTEGGSLYPDSSYKEAKRQFERQWRFHKVSLQDATEKQKKNFAELMIETASGWDFFADGRTPLAISQELGVNYNFELTTGTTPLETEIDRYLTASADTKAEFRNEERLFIRQYTL